MRYTCYPLLIPPIPFTNRIIPFSHESNRISIHHINTLTHQNNPVLHKSGYNCVYTSHRIIRIIKSKNRVNMQFSYLISSIQFLIFLLFAKRNHANISRK